MNTPSRRRTTARSTSSSRSLAPGDRCLQRLVPRRAACVARRRATGSGRRASAAIAFGGIERTTRCRELDRQRHAVEPAADLRDAPRALASVSAKPRRARRARSTNSWTASNSLDRRDGRARRAVRAVDCSTTAHATPPHRERSASPCSCTPRSRCSRPWCTASTTAAADANTCSALSSTSSVGCRPRSRLTRSIQRHPTRRLVDAEPTRHCGEHARMVGARCELRSTRVPPGNWSTDPCRELQCEAGLPATARAGQRHHAFLAQRRSRVRRTRRHDRCNGVTRAGKPSRGHGRLVVEEQPGPFGEVG